jgi:hypothetical protein
VGIRGGWKNLEACSMSVQGLRSMVEEIMLDSQFDLLPLTDAVVRGEKPLFDKPAAADKKSACWAEGTRGDGRGTFPATRMEG